MGSVDKSAYAFWRPVEFGDVFIVLVFVISVIVIVINLELLIFSQRRMSVGRGG